MRSSRVLLAAVLLAALLLRVRGLDWGLPWALHIDERLFVVSNAIQMDRDLGTGIPDPGITSYGILPLWLLVLARRLFLGAVTGEGAPTWGDPFAGTVLLARALSAAWGVAAVALTAAWASRWGRPAAIAAAALVAGFPALVQASHFGTVEAPLVALLAAGMLAAERLAERPSGRRLMEAGVVLGLAASVKAPGLVLALPMLHAAGGDGMGARARRVAGIAVAAAVVVVALNPALVLAPPSPDGEHTTLGGNLRRAYSSEFHDWTLPYANDRPVVTELTRLLPYAVGILPELLALVGLGMLARRRRPEDVRLLLLAAPILLLLFGARVKTVRFLVPALPALAVAAAVAADRLLGAWPRARVPGLAVLAGLTLLHGLAFTAVYAGTDPRVEAAMWLDENVPPTETVAIEDPPGYGPPIGSPSAALRRAPLRIEILWKDFYDVHDRRTPDERERHLRTVLRRSDWLALSEGHRREFTSGLRPVEQKFYEELDAGRLGYELVREFDKQPRLGPLVLRDDGAEALMRGFDHPRIQIWHRERSE